MIHPSIERLFGDNIPTQGLLVRREENVNFLRRTKQFSPSSVVKHAHKKMFNFYSTFSLVLGKVSEWTFLEVYWFCHWI